MRTFYFSEHTLLDPSQHTHFTQIQNFKPTPPSIEIYILDSDTPNNSPEVTDLDLTSAGLRPSYVHMVYDRYRTEGDTAVKQNGCLILRQITN